MYIHVYVTPYVILFPSSADIPRLTGCYFNFTLLGSGTRNILHIVLQTSPTDLGIQIMSVSCHGQYCAVNFNKCNFVLFLFQSGAPVLLLLLFVTSCIVFNRDSCHKSCIKIASVEIPMSLRLGCIIKFKRDVSLSDSQLLT